MRNVLTAFLMCCCAINMASASTTPDLENKTVQEINHYYHEDEQGASEYQKDAKQVIDLATAYLAKRIAEASPAQIAKMAVVFDIDDTLLWRYAHEKSVSYVYKPAVFEKHQMEEIDPLVPYIKSLYQLALTHHLKIFLITAGCQHVVNAEIKNLNQNGITGWQAIYAKPDHVCHDHRVTSKDFKTDKRKVIEQQGYDIVLNVGDQATDLGPYADKNFKLPNPVYTVK